MNVFKYYDKYGEKLRCPNILGNIRYCATAQTDLSLCWLLISHRLFYCSPDFSFNTQRRFGITATSLPQLAFYVNLHRAVIGPSATLTGRWRPDIDLRRMLTGTLRRRRGNVVWKLNSSYYLFPDTTSAIFAYRYFMTFYILSLCSNETHYKICCFQLQSESALCCYYGGRINWKCTFEHLRNPNTPTWAEEQHFLQVCICSQRKQMSLRIRGIWSEFFQDTLWVVKDTKRLQADCEDSGQSVRMRKFVWVFAGLTCKRVGYACPNSFIMYIRTLTSEQLLSTNKF